MKVTSNKHSDCELRGSDLGNVKKGALTTNTNKHMHTHPFTCKSIAISAMTSAAKCGCVICPRVTPRIGFTGHLIACELVNGQMQRSVSQQTNRTASGTAIDAQSESDVFASIIDCTLIDVCLCANQ